ncbi:hypothetical protein C8J56DRAFT_1056335 [Mycena floridula]|nr:hypothetical protein C8J56DRAFT_1056335 [Mycena floridula]
MSLSIVSAAPTGTGKPLPASKPKPKPLAEVLADIHFRHRNRFKPKPRGTSGNIKEGSKMDEAGKLNARGDDKIPVKSFGIGQDVQPKKDMKRLTKWPEEVARRQGEKVIKAQKIPPATARFSQ